MKSIAFAAAIGAAIAASAATVAADEPQRRITVVGQGSAQAQPDMARAAFGVTARAPDAAQAWAQVAARASAVLAAVRKSGVAEADIQTVSLAMQPVYTMQRDAAPTLDGYEARQGLSVVVRDLAALGPLLDAAAAAGADAFDGVSFDVADRGPLQDAARRAAIADARRTAALLAEGAGAELGRPVDITLMGGGGPQPMMMRAAADEAMPIAAGTLSISAEVSATFALED